MQPVDLQEINMTGERLEVVREKLEINKSELARRIGSPQSHISKVLNGKEGIGKHLSEQIVKQLRLNPVWWETGEGTIFLRPTGDEAVKINMLDETDVTVSSTGMEFRDLDNGMVLMTMPLVDEFAYASYPHGWKDPEYVIELPKYSIVLPTRERGFYRAFEVRGESMYDGSINSICFGDVAVGRLIEPDYWDQKLYINGGTDYIIVTHDGIIIKRITRHDTKEGIITCSSINPDKKEYPDFDVRLSEVYELYKIRKVDRDWNSRR